MCEICDRIELIKQDKEPYFIKEYHTGYLSLFDNQHYEGYCLFIFKQHLDEIYEINHISRAIFFDELSEIVEKINILYEPVKMNYCILGNGCRHLHVHIIPNNVGQRTIWHRDYKEDFSKDIKSIISDIRAVLC